MTETMKKAILMAAAAVFALAGCKKEEDTSVDVSQLAGKWSYFQNDPYYDGSRIYTFDGNGGYEMADYDTWYRSNPPKIHRGTYTLSADGKLLTLSGDENGKYAGRYHIVKLNAGEMKWKYDSSFTVPFVAPKPIQFRGQATYVKVTD